MAIDYIPVDRLSFETFRQAAPSGPLDGNGNTRLFTYIAFAWELLFILKKAVKLLPELHLPIVAGCQADIGF